jgi:hypothetical protein
MAEVHLSSDNITAVSEAEREMALERQSTRATVRSRMGRDQV